MNAVRAVLILALWAVLSGPLAHAQDADEDPLDLVALLVRDQQWDRATIALTDVDAGRLRAPAVPRYHTLSGLIAAGTERWDDAVIAFQTALDVTAADPRSEGPDPTVVLQLAQALQRAGRPREAVALLDTAPESVLSMSATWLLKAGAAEEAGEPQIAWDALAEGARRFPDRIDFPRRQVVLLVRQSLYQEAATQGALLLARADAEVQDVLVLAEALRRGGAVDRAADVLIQGRLRFPADVAVYKQSAAVALARGRLREAAQDLTIAAELDPALAYEAAEVWRQAGDLMQAQRLNARVPDATKKARQRLGLLLDAESWDQVLALETRLDRLQVSDDDAVTYGLAYAHFRVGDLDRAEARLKRISDPRVYQLATELRSAMQACRDDVWACP